MILNWAWAAKFTMSLIPITYTLFQQKKVYLDVALMNLKTEEQHPNNKAQ